MDIRVKDLVELKDSGRLGVVVWMDDKVAEVNLLSGNVVIAPKEFFIKKRSGGTNHESDGSEEQTQA